jgi:hypothetical protein
MKSKPKKFTEQAEHGRITAKLAAHFAQAIERTPSAEPCLTAYREITGDTGGGLSAALIFMADRLHIPFDQIDDRVSYEQATHFFTDWLRLHRNSRVSEAREDAHPRIGQKLKAEHVAFIEGAGLGKTATQIKAEFAERFEFSISDRTVRKYRNMWGGAERSRKGRKRSARP